MLLLSEIWIGFGGVAAVLLVLCWLILRKKRGDYTLNRHEHPSGLDFAHHQAELKIEQARIDQERQRAATEARRLAAQANTGLQIVAHQESRELREMAHATSADIETLRDSRSRELERQAQDAKRRQREEVEAIIKKQSDAIARVRAEQERQIAIYQAEYERAREAHFSASRSSEPRPAVVSYAMTNPAQELASVMQAGYAQVAWAFEALARKREQSSCL
jgi:hypothetical protein